MAATAATNVVVVSSTTITATTPAGSAGAVTVTVTNVGSQSGSLANGFTYVVVPTVTSVSSEQRINGGRHGGHDHGHELRHGSDGDVRSDGSDQRGGGEQHDDHGHDPAGSAGAVTVTVTVGGQSGSLTNGFTYVGRPDGEQCVAE